MVPYGHQFIVILGMYTNISAEAKGPFVRNSPSIIGPNLFLDHRERLVPEVRLCKGKREEPEITQVCTCFADDSNLFTLINKLN